MSQEMARRCLWIQDAAASSPLASEQPASASEREHRRRVAALHKTLKCLLLDRHVIKWQAAPPHCHGADQLAAALTDALDELLDEMDAREPPASKAPVARSLLDDVSQHLAFCQRAASACVNRDAALMVVKRYLNCFTFILLSLYRSTFDEMFVCFFLG